MLLNRLLLILVGTLLLPGPLAAQGVSSDRAYRLQGRHGLSLNVGMLNWASVEAGVSPGSVEADTRLNGFLGSIRYDYFLQEDLSLNVSAGGTAVGVSADVSAGTVRSESDAVGFVLVGATLYPTAVAFKPNVRGFMAAAVGPYVGSATNTIVEIGSVSAESFSESVLGARFAVGVDWIAARWLRIGGNLGYHLVADFDRSIGGSDNYSGPELSASIGLLIGRGTR